MILLKSKNLQGWLDATGKNQQWLSTHLGIGKAYMSMIMHNKCRIYSGLADRLINLTHASFDSFFLVLPQVDDREFYGKDIWILGKMTTSKEYPKQIEELLNEEDRHLQPVFPPVGNKKW
jgi:hypothetical protein